MRDDLKEACDKAATMAEEAWVKSAVTFDEMRAGSYRRVYIVPTAIAVLYVALAGIGLYWWLS